MNKLSTLLYYLVYRLTVKAYMIRAELGMDSDVITECARTIFLYSSLYNTQSVMCLHIRYRGGAVYD